MPKSPIMPVHILYDEDAIADGNYFREKLRELALKLETTPASVLVRLSVIQLARTLKLSEPKEFRNAMVRGGDYCVDLRAAFDQVLANYRDLQGEGLANPEVLIFLGSQPASGWETALKEFRSQGLPVVILAYWMSQQSLSDSDRKSITKLLLQISHRYKIVEPPESKNREQLAQVISLLQQRIEKNRGAGRALTPIQAPHKAAAAPASGLRPAAPQPTPVTPPPPAQEVAVAPVAESKPEKVASLAPEQALQASAVPGEPQVPQAADQGAGASQVSGPSARRDVSAPSEPPQATPLPARPQPAKWDVKEPPAELEDRKPHTLTDSRPESRGWYVVGASRRGKLHEHDGTFREDAFKIENEAGWYLVAVADGAGSHYLSRVGSNLAVETAVSTMVKAVRSESPGKSVARAALQDALVSAWQALWEEAERRKVDFRDLSTTLLLLAYYPGQNLVGVAQVGDGLIAAQLEDDKIALLGKPESGEYSGQTYFLTNHKYEELAAKVETPEPPGPVKLFFVMSDGVADDLYPPQDRLPGLVRPMPGIMASADREKALLDLIGYERSGSFDDRTLVVLCQPEKLKSSRPAPVVKPVESEPPTFASSTQPVVSAGPEGEGAAAAPGEVAGEAVVSAQPEKETPAQPDVSTSGAAAQD